MFKALAIALALALAIHGDAARNLEHDREPTTTAITSTL